MAKSEKKLKPSLRQKKRYLLVEGGNKEDIDKAILKYIGVLGYGKAGVKHITKNIIAVNRDMVNDVRASLALSDKKMGVKLVSGSLKKLKGKI